MEDHNCYYQQRIQIIEADTIIGGEAIARVPVCGLASVQVLYLILFFRLAGRDTSPSTVVLFFFQNLYYLWYKKRKAMNDELSIILAAETEEFKNCQLKYFKHMMFSSCGLLLLY